MTIEEGATNQAKPLLALPYQPTNQEQSDTTVVNVDGPATSLVDKMGPVVVHEDGSISRIANWDKMTEEEQSRTLRVLCKRNAERLAKLRETSGDDSSQALTKSPETPSGD